MKSPFPGMDPYLQQYRPDVYSALVVSAREKLNESLPPGLVTRAEERVVLLRPHVCPKKAVTTYRATVRLGVVIVEALKRLSP